MRDKRTPKDVCGEAKGGVSVIKVLSWGEFVTPKFHVILNV